MKWHIGRSWYGSPLEDDCPCPKAECGLVVQEEADPDCIEHGINHTAKTMRQGHFSTDCIPHQDGA